MWYVFPQIEVLGGSEMSRWYSIKREAEAKAYLEHPVLGARLRECFGAVQNVEGRSAFEIFGSPDDLKLRSSATLFAAASDEPVFGDVLQQYFDGKPDEETLRRLGQGTSQR